MGPWRRHRTDIRCDRPTDVQEAADNDVEIPEHFANVLQEIAAMCPTTTKAFQQIFDNDDEMYDTWAPKFKKITNRYAQKVLKASQAGPAAAKQSKLSMLPKGKVPANTTRGVAASTAATKKPSSVVSLHSTNSSSSTSGTRQVSRQSSTSASTSNSGRASRYVIASWILSRVRPY